MRAPIAALLCAWIATDAFAVSATKSLKLSCGAAGSPGLESGVRRGTLQGGRLVYPPVPTCEHAFEFLMEVEPSGGARLAYGPGGRPLMLLSPGTRYSVTLHNPLPVRVAVNLTVDGLNTLTGEPGTPAGGSKWLIPPRSRITVSGWQTGRHSAREFVVTSRQASYARWRSDAWARDLSVNCGVIGAAFFWSSGELAAALAGLHQHRSFSRAKAAGALRGPAAEDGGRDGFDAGTGMGERIASPVRAVRFAPDAGMYDPDDALVVFYDFDDPRVLTPRPVQPPIWRQKPRFAPEMPRAYER